MTKRRKALIFISNEGDIQRFISRNAFEALAENFDLHYILPGGAYDVAPNGLPPEAHADKIEKIEIDPKCAAIWNRLAEIYFFRYRRFSNAYNARVHGVYYPVYGKGFPLPDVWRQGLKGKVRYIWRWIKYLVPSFALWQTKLQSSRLFYDQTRNDLLNSLGDRAWLGAIIDAAQPDIIIVPTSFHDLFVHDVQQAMKTRSTPYLLLQSNWDNPSAKGKLFEMPRYVGMWGEQSKRLSVKCLDLKEDSITLIGAAQFEDFRFEPTVSRSEFLQRINLGPEDNYFVYAGNARNFDDLYVLSLLEDAIERSELPPCRIVYRPHPWTKGQRHVEFSRRQWRYTVLDIESRVANADDDSRDEVNMYYSFAHLNALYTYANCMVVPMSTAIVEALLKGLPVVAITYSDGASYYNPKLISEMEHCVDLWNFDGVFKCDRERDIVRFVSEAWNFGLEEGSAERLKDASRYFVDMGDRSYGERLLDLTVSILDNETAAAAAKE